AQPMETSEAPPIEGNSLDTLNVDIPERARDLFGGYLDFAELLGRRTAELHIALSSDSHNDAFAPQPINAMYRRSLYQSSRTRLDQAFNLLKKRIDSLPEDVEGDARVVFEAAKRIDRRLRAIVDKKVQGQRIRCHGDYHLGQVLYTGKDLLIMDFEGEPARPISERRLKRSPLTDVAGMLRSFDYASVAAVIAGRARPEDLKVLEPWTQYWYLWTSASFLKAYRETAAEAAFLPKNEEQFAALLDVFLFDKALYELAYELNNRPGWVGIPLRGLIRLLEGAQDVDGLGSL
ncbi:MAG: alpha-amylase, partial [Anaerolineales bacterium]